MAVPQRNAQYDPALRWITPDERFMSAIRREQDWRMLLGWLQSARLNIYKAHHDLIPASARWHSFGFETKMLVLVPIAYRAAAAGVKPEWPESEGFCNYAFLCEAAALLPVVRPDSFVDTECGAHASCTMADTNLYSFFRERYCTWMKPPQILHDLGVAYRYMIWLLEAFSELAAAERAELDALDPLLAHR